MHKKKMLEKAQERRIRNPESLKWKKWAAKRKQEVEEYQARKAAEEAERAELQGVNDTIASLCASE